MVTTATTNNNSKASTSGRQQRRRRRRKKTTQRRRRQISFSTNVILLITVCVVIGWSGMSLMFLYSFTNTTTTTASDQQQQYIGPHTTLLRQARQRGDALLGAAAAHLRRGGKQQQKNNPKSPKDHSKSTTIHNNIFPPNYPIVTRNDKNVQLLLSSEVLDMCHNTLWHTLETTTIVLSKNKETFVHTGDIDDLWLRDSAAQVHPLLVPMISSDNNTDNTKRALVSTDAKLARIVSGLIKRCAWYIRHDPYANAFRIDDTYKFSQAQKDMGRHDFISTWNYELDSACYYMRMIYFYYQAHPKDVVVLKEESIKEAIDIMLEVWIAEQHHEDDAVASGPLLDCLNCGKPYRYPGLARNGKGNPTTYTGMTWTGFRPSDDECQYNYLIPANMFAVVVLNYMIELAPILWKDTDALIQKATKLVTEIEEGIQQYGIVHHAKYGQIYAYEVDGLGNSLLMDDANVPSLMSIPYLGYDYDATIYANTRRFILSTDNPTYQHGTNPMTGDIEGYGSPHMNKAIRNNIWPMSIAMQALTCDNVEEKVRLTNQLYKASAGTGWMHESFDVSNPKRFTRSWFCWADALFAELVMSLTDQCPSSSDNGNKKKYHVMSWRDPVTVKGGIFSAE